MQLSEYILLQIGQNYLKDTQHIKKLFYHNEDDKLQELLFDEGPYTHKQFPKTTIPLDGVLKNPNEWMCINGIKKFTNVEYSLFEVCERVRMTIDRLIESSINDEYTNLLGEFCERVNDDEYKIFITFEIKNDDFMFKIEYVCKGFDEPAIYCIDNISFTIDNEKIN